MNKKLKKKKIYKIFLKDKVKNSKLNLKHQYKNYQYSLKVIMDHFLILIQ